MKLLLSAVVKILLGLLLAGGLLFLPAGTLRYPGAWLLIAALFIPTGVLSAVLSRRSPELLRKRLNMRERETAQKHVVALTGLMLMAGFILAGLDFRFAWSRVAPVVMGIAAAVFILGYGLYAETLRENAYLSRTVEVQEGQQVVSTGLYGVVRHPMYMATTLMFLAIPVMLGSWWALLVFAPYPLLMARRIAGEEQLLRRELAGYEDYTRKVRWRMLPFVW